VQQLQEALAERQPQLEILEPKDGTLLGSGPWSLRLAVRDWPLVNAGPLGLGPHVVVQLDGAPPRAITTTEITLPPLSPGSHRLTVYAARPWGEAVKSPGAQAQIRLHRSAANPLALPAAGSPQLIPVQPVGDAVAADDPVLLDWLLLDAPLQHLRDGDDRWRLRVTVNGDSFLVDRAQPLWLRGWRRGANPVLLELLDGRGEPLNPPFNSVVTELTLARDQPRPAWLEGPLSPAARAILLGEAPPESLQPPPPAGPEQEGATEPATAPAEAGEPAAAAPGEAPAPEPMAEPLAPLEATAAGSEEGRSTSPPPPKPPAARTLPTTALPWRPTKARRSSPRAALQPRLPLGPPSAHRDQRTPGRPRPRASSPGSPASAPANRCATMAP
jgi:hypothetical protein